MFTGFALGLFFYRHHFPQSDFFCAIFLNLEPDFWPFLAKKIARFWGIFRKKSLLVFNPLNSGGLFYTH